MPSSREVHAQSRWLSSFSSTRLVSPDSKHPHLGLSQMLSPRKAWKSWRVPMIPFSLFKSSLLALFHNWFLKLFLFCKHGEHKLPVSIIAVKLHFQRKLLPAYSVILNSFINCINIFTRVLNIHTRHFLKYLHLMIIKYTQFKNSSGCYNREHIFKRGTKEKVAKEN